MKLITGILLMFAGLCTVTAQDVQDLFKTWKTLAKIEYRKEMDEYGEIYVPSFNEEIQGLEGKEIVLPGYIIPFEGMFKPEQVILSSLPIASCFFCGGGGPETVAEAKLSEPIKYTSKLVSIRGTLRLNDSNADELMYILEDATLVDD